MGQQAFAACFDEIEYMIEPVIAKVRVGNFAGLGRRIGEIEKQANLLAQTRGRDRVQVAQVVGVHREDQIKVMEVVERDLSCTLG